MTQLILGFLFGGLIAFAAYRARALSPSGAWGATLTGGLIFGLGGIPWAVLLLIFFISSSALSRAFARKKAPLGEKFSKGSQRDLGQVLANGGLGALLAVLTAVFPDQVWPWIAFAGTMAAVNADTWATELGVLSRRPPRLITTGKVVERGSSGGVTLVGYLAVLAGAALIGVAAVLFSPGLPALGLLAIILLGGLAGSTFDSFLGATVQAIYFCPQCQKDTERHPLHLCGAQTSLARGWPWLNNDLVNFCCALAGAGMALAAGWLLIR
jgi:uncharacterized protein (TIGR00297 family)